MSPQKRPFPWEDEDAHPTRGSLGPQESTSQTAFQKAQAFRITMCSTDHRTSVTCIVMQRKNWKLTGWPILLRLSRKYFAVSPYNKKLRYRRVTTRCILSVVILPIATQQCRNYLYDKSWPNWWYEVGGLVGGNVPWTICTQPWRDRVSSHCLRCHKETDDGRIVYITCIPTTCCGEIF